MTCQTYSIIFSLCLTFSSCAFIKKPEVPKFADNYKVEGILLLPYAEIKEPFVSFYDAANNRSRIDYYGGMVKTYQRADLSVSYKIAFMPDSKGTPRRTCFQVNASIEAPVEVQSILPDLSAFSHASDETCISLNGFKLLCEVWVLENTVGNKANHYAMYLTKGSQEPVRYVMKGYNTLLGSHYDKYEVYYTSFSVGSVSDNDFEIETGLQCRNFPGPGVVEMVSNNPMLEFISNEDRHIHKAFDEFKTTHKKSYPSDKDHEWRKAIFLQNYRYVNSMNRRGLSYSLAINHLADFSDLELRKLRGRLPSKGYNGGKPFPNEKFPSSIPEFVDWQLFGAVTPVKDQAVCGSCWSFGTTGTIEGAYFLKNKKLVRLSQQQLIDCSWPFENNGCDGGEDFRAYKYIMEAGGLATEDEYGSYLGQDGICHDRNVTKTAVIKGYVNVTSGDAKALKKAIAFKGPISVSIDAAHKSLSFYSYGVYYEPDCKNDPDGLDHSVLAVGYGTADDHDYWIIKNSWSTYWGNDGYVLMSQQDNNCGVTTMPTYVLM